LYVNRAIALVNLGEEEEALEAFRDVLTIARREGSLQNECDALQNLGAMFGMMSKSGMVTAYMDSLAFYQRLAMSVSKKLGDRNGQLLLYSNIAVSMMDRGRDKTALLYLDSAKVLADELRNLEMAATIAKARSKAFFHLGKPDSAYQALRSFVALNDSLLNTEKVKAIADMQEKYETEKKVRTIKELEVENLDSRLKSESLRRTRNIYLFSALGILGLAAGLWSRLRYTRRSRRAIQKEKDVSEGLLLNILPAEVAKELKEKGHAEAQLIDEVTVLFTDFKGFTAMSETLTPQALVHDLNICFSEFDHIMATYGIEKIKTIGDAYMAACGLPLPNDKHAEQMIRAAFEMRDFVEAGKARKIAAGLPYFEVRIGIHTGPVVAGIVGVKKFQYDIWGDTVNTASRMESSGEVGLINISETTYELVRDNTDFSFTSRGKIEAKGKGAMDMYFVAKGEKKL
jgi:adenylate cyclase